MKVLVVEDNMHLAARIKQQLTSSCIVDVVHSGAAALQQAEAVDYSVIVLDLKLPDMHGLAICKRLRAAQNTTPLLILTGLANNTLRVRLLNAGADDYLLKPFDGDELVARVRALARRQRHQYTTSTMTVDDLELNIDRRQAQRAGIPISLRRKEFSILEYLMRNNGRAVSRQMILDYAWEEGVEHWNNTVDVHIKHLRDKVDRPFHRPLIKTAYGIGYMMDEKQ